MSKRDYYEVLDLVPSCTITDVKKNYHKLALIWHPDKHIDKCEAQSKFTEIHEAYSVLGDANKRKIYDTKGHKGLCQDEDDITSCNVKNFFCQKGFNGTDKSAFDVLRDIFVESDDDDDFFRSCNMFKCPDGFKSNLESFFDENKFLSENEDCVSFCKGYTPTFMDADFFQPSGSLFSAAFPEDSCTSQTEFFSFFTSVNSEVQGFSRTSATVGNKKKSKKCPKQQAEKCQKQPKKGCSQKDLNAEEVTFQCTLQNNTINCKRSSTFECEQFFEALFSQDDDDFFDAEMQELQKNIFFVSDKKCKEKKKSYTMKPQDEQPAAEFKSRKKMRSHTNI